ncbi:DASH complex subunit Hsk3 like-domain-containing protein [Neurospora tetraspora]|uniref:DASH complex subunit Hsk3 like-domain-containing protein n=1 Tax=Neurospora tetraspora TaxID=94610 RepID=A0AAE0MKC4_9PEZI|nr:DASH complex subunit Hsk3 like-domain-containing protein [Neurospora tetraspora]
MASHRNTIFGTQISSGAGAGAGHGGGGGGGYGGGRQSMAPGASSTSGQSGAAVKARQISQLHAQLTQLSNNLADTENLLRMTSVQAECMRGLGSWHGGLFMAASKVLGEESVQSVQAQQVQVEQQQQQGGGQGGQGGQQQR